MSELLYELGIDWKLLIAQVVNFAILAFVLAHFAYRPLMRVLAERRGRIERGEEAAREALSTRAEAEELKRHAIDDGKREAAALIAAAKESAARARESLMERARVEAETLRASKEREIRDAARASHEQVKRESAELLAEAIEHTIGGVLDERAEKKLLEDAVEFMSREVARKRSGAHTP